MEFVLRAESDDILRSVHDFPGDEDISDEAYMASINDSYMPTVATIMGAAEGFGLDIDKETFERWKRVLSAMGHLDDLLDESPDRRLAQELYGQCLDYLAGGPKAAAIHERDDKALESSIALLKNSIAPLPVPRQKLLLESAARIGQLAQEKSECNEVKKYAQLLAEEGRLTADLLADTVSDQVYLQAGFRGFDNWITYTTVWVNIIFSARDLRKDNNTGTTSVERGLLNRAKIVRYSGKLAITTTGVKPDRRASLTSIRTRIRYGLIR